MDPKNVETAEPIGIFFGTSHHDHLRFIANPNKNSTIKSLSCTILQLYPKTPPIEELLRKKQKYFEFLRFSRINKFF